MKSLVKIVVSYFAIIGAHEVYKEYNSRKTSTPVVGSLDNEKTTLFPTFNR